MRKFLILDLEAPLLAFGGEVVDSIGVVSDFPLTSSLTGLIANAFGWDRTEDQRHAELQSSIRFAAAIVEEGHHLVDFQTSEIKKNDKGWTRKGVETRGGSSNSYDSPHLRHVHYHMDRKIVVALELTGGDLTLEAVSDALSTPVRPLFLGRKACLPSAYLVRGVVEAESLGRAIEQAVNTDARLMLPDDEPPMPGDRVTFFADLRDWSVGVHTGGRHVRHRRHIPEAML